MIFLVVEYSNGRYRVEVIKQDVVLMALIAHDSEGFNTIYERGVDFVKQLTENLAK